ncbi:hypothetical protein FV139_20530 [Parahaliea maris]|uniref:Uncharacterized protein n=1 Tax=Parahaliea maris TaxID=2716870 RepID=A0A5C8ZKV5_9GAMM|nr:hypothetical protein [Parahaliea maris]TXS89068.1 hypothetical protein FV139_20530 [Parahaliea maris]
MNRPTNTRSTSISSTQLEDNHLLTSSQLGDLGALFHAAANSDNPEISRRLCSIGQYLCEEWQVMQATEVASMLSGAED